MSKIYVASSWRNPLQPFVVKVLQGDNHVVYDFRNPKSGDNGFHWSEIDADWQSWGVNEYLKGLEHPLAVNGFNNDFAAMKWADTCVLVLPCGRSAHLEAGWFIGQGRRVIILTQNGEEPELMYKMAAKIVGDCEELLTCLSSTPAPADEDGE